MSTVKKDALDPSSSNPINVQIFEILRDRILSNEYEENGSLPTELSLVDEFGVSRHTIRAAMQRLIVDGFIARKRGSGTTILPRKPSGASWATGSLDLMVAKPFDIELLDVGIVLAAPHAQARDVFRLDKSDQLFQVRSIMRSEGTPLFHSNLFTRTEYGRRVPEERIGKDFFLNLLEESVGLRAIRARQRTEAVVPDAEICRLLQIGRTEPLLLLHRTFFGKAGEPIQYVQMHVRSDTSPQITNFYRQEELKKLA